MHDKAYICMIQDKISVNLERSILPMTENKKPYFMVRVDEHKASAFKSALKSHGQSAQFILEKAIDKYIEESKTVESPAK